MLVIQIALLVAILITIVGVCFDIYSKVKEIKEQKTKKALKDLLNLAILSALTKELDKTLKENNEETEKDKDFVLSVFKMRLLCILGFMPRVTKCVSCKEEKKLSKFSIRDNGFKCEACGRQDKSSLDMSESTRSAILYTISAPPKKLYSFSLKDDSLREFELISKIYFNEKLEKEYKLEDLF